MSIASIAAFWTVATLLIIVPGADWAFVIDAAVGSRSVLPAVGGLVLGYAAVTALVAAGVGAAVAGSPGVLTGLTIAGGGYLMWHGTSTFAHPATPLTQTDDAGAGDAAALGVTSRQTLIRGIGVSGLNPKGLLIFLALLPQFTSTRGSWPIAAQISALGLVFVLSCAAFYLALGTFARTVLHAKPSLTRVVSRVAGGAMVAIGLLLIVERLTT